MDSPVQCERMTVPLAGCCLLLPCSLARRRGRPRKLETEMAQVVLSILPGPRCLGQAPSGSGFRWKEYPVKSCQQECWRAWINAWTLVWRREGESSGPCWREGWWAVWRYGSGTGCESSRFRERGSVLTGERESLPVVSKEGL